MYLIKDNHDESDNDKWAYPLGNQNGNLLPLKSGDRYLMPLSL